MMTRGLKNWNQIALCCCISLEMNGMGGNDTVQSRKGEWSWFIERANGRCASDSWDRTKLIADSAFGISVSFFWQANVGCGFTRHITERHRGRNCANLFSRARDWRILYRVCTSNNENYGGGRIAQQHMT